MGRYKIDQTSDVNIMSVNDMSLCLRILCKNVLFVKFFAGYMALFSLERWLLVRPVSLRQTMAKPKRLLLKCLLYLIDSQQ